MKKVYWIVMAVLVLAAATAGSAAIAQHRHLKSLKKQVADQTVIIDSLLKRRMTVMDVRLNVTDKSRNTIYGRYNKGTITIPTQKTYLLELDSVSMKAVN